jgi:lipoprotein NlpD
LLSQLSCAGRDQPAPVDRLYQGKSFLDFEAGSLRQESYQVVAGDTLYSIAFRANVDVRTLAQWNQLRDPYLIVPGQTLRLATPQANQQGIDPVAKKEYRDTKPQQNNDKKITPTPRSTPSPTRIEVAHTGEIFASNNDIRWQWPASARVITEFSTAEAGSKGLDFSGGRGDPVYAAATGKVVYVGNALKGFGNLIILKHNDDYITAYAHNQQLLVKEQQWVNGGDEIAKMGDSDAEQVKLHFQVRFRGKSVNPRHYLPRGKQ